MAAEERERGVWGMYISLAKGCGFTLLLVRCMTTRIDILSGREIEGILSKNGFHYMRDDLFLDGGVLSFVLWLCDQVYASYNGPQVLTVVPMQD